MNEPTIKTSETSPIRVDFVAGRPLGLTFAPGKTGSSLMGAYVWQRDLETDVTRLVEHYSVACLVTLLDAAELEMLEISNLREAARAQGMKSHSFPIVDGGVPEELGPFTALVRTIRSSLGTGERVVVHCRGGLGRAGTVAACVLVSMGESAAAAIEHVRDARPGAIENERQENFVSEFYTFWNERSSS